MNILNSTEATPAPTGASVPEALLEQFRPLLEAHAVPHEHWENMVLFVEEQLADDDPFIAIVDGDERLLGFVEDVLAQENEVLGEALHDLLDVEPPRADHDPLTDSTLRG